MRIDQAIKFKNLKRGQFLHSNFLYTDYTLDYTLASLERIGAKKLEFYGAEPHLCFYDLTYGDMAGFAENAAEAEELPQGPRRPRLPATSFAFASFLLSFQKE